ncbi:MAG: c-type cytochrome [Candidatus Rariloculaceae bacterium]
MMIRLARAAAILLLLSQVAVGWAFPWNKDMVDQPVPKAQRSQAPAEPDAIPTTGTETLPTSTTDIEFIENKDNAATLENPIPMTAESVETGQYLFELNCVVCHGVEGVGDGPVGLLLAVVPVDINLPYTQDQTDGQLFYTLTRGRVTMPYYRDALSREERWHVINYIRAEFGPE